MNTFLKKITFALLLAGFFFSCTKEDDTSESTNTVQLDLRANLLITNEGNFTKNNASIDVLRYKGDLIANINSYAFETANSVQLGDVLQSAMVNDSLIFLVVNNSNKVEVIKSSDFTSVKTITGFANPRNIVKVSDSKAYISYWGSNGLGDEIKILDLNSLTVTGTINTNASGPDGMIVSGNYVYVANSGGWGQSDTITILNASDNSIFKQVRAWEYPQGFEVDANGDVWVNCRGTYNAGFVSVNTALVKIDGSTNTVTDTINTGASTSFITRRLAKNANGDKLYYIQNDGVYEFPISSSSPSGSPFIAGSFNGVGVDPQTGLVFTGVNNFSSNVTSSGIKVYSSSGGLSYSFLSGIAPNNFYFF